MVAAPALLLLAVVHACAQSISSAVSSLSEARAYASSTSVGPYALFAGGGWIVLSCGRYL